MLFVRVLAVGEEGARALRGLETAVAGTWASLGDVHLLSETVGDDARQARSALKRWCKGDVDVVLTLGRAGHGCGDFVPEVTAGLVERRLPGIEERMCLAPPVRAQNLLFRGVAGFCGATLLVNLPGRGARAAAILRFLAPVVIHALGKARGDTGECGRPRMER